VTEARGSPKSSSRRKQYSAPALEKGLDILELLSSELEGLNTTQIAQRLNRSVSEIFRMLVVLEQRSYVVNRPGSDLYTLSLKMFELSHRYPPVKLLTVSAGPIMRQLSYAIEQSCHLVVYYDGKGHVVVQQDSPSERIFSVRLGAEAPLVNTCSGHLLLAFADENERRIMIDRIPGHHPGISKRNLAALIKGVLAAGFERIKSVQAEGVEDIGYPVFDYTGRIVAALVVPFVSYLDGSHPVKIDKVQEYVRDAAGELSDKLGYIAD